MIEAVVKRGRKGLRVTTSIPREDDEKNKNKRSILLSVYEEGWVTVQYEKTALTVNQVGNVSTSTPAGQSKSQNSTYALYCLSLGT